MGRHLADIGGIWASAGRRALLDSARSAGGATEGGTFIAISESGGATA